MFVIAQANKDTKRDYQWLFGYKYTTFSTNLMDFNSRPAKISGISVIYAQARNNNANICDTSGQLLLYTNGCNILNHNLQIIANSDSLNKGPYKDAFCTAWRGLKVPQSSIFMPKPKYDSIYYLFHNTINEYGYCLESMMSTINVKAKEGKGLVTELNRIVIKDSIEYRVTANRHANGQDWWIMLCSHTLDKQKEDIYYKILVTADTVQVFKQTLGKLAKRKNNYYSQNTFSPDGTKFIRYRDKDGIYLYDFDRQTGLLSNPRNIFINGNDWFNGVSFSPNSRFIYALANEDLFQVDTWESDSSKSKELIAKWDGFNTNGFPTSFCYAQLGPDCKIYVSAQGSTEYVSVINHPNRKGLASGVEQHAIKTPTKIAWAMPNYPHFRLGAVGEKHTPCDSTINPYITVTKNIKEEVPVTFAVYPNPAQSHINVDLFGYVNRYERGTWDLYDMSGKLAVSFPLLQGHSEYVFDISSVPNGVYVWRVSFNGVPTSFAGKMVVLKE